MSTESKVSDGKQGRTVVVEQRVRIGLASLGDAARQAVEEALSSEDRVRSLLQKAKKAGAGGQFRVAPIEPGLRLVMRVTPKQVRVVEVMDAEAFDSLGIRVEDGKE